MWFNDYHHLWRASRQTSGAPTIGFAGGSVGRCSEPQQHDRNQELIESTHSIKASGSQASRARS